MAASGLLLPVTVMCFSHSSLSGIFFLAVVALRVLCLLPAVKLQRPPAALADQSLPVYSVLVPLFREASVLPQLLEALR